ncbi:CaiB/BaiF CoA-transferase family protein [Croceicoccus sp. F390]|uniref:CaiB/BaiF CoA-transferase family protein n=1 Tax=Croceicoccus esteveae TaxID=3075597 RepID=A0ABU2ZI95_9SPHN|nr:CaiB/BaiF CoA-transferase family protein [Croceicoccus sp. F390]MDT0576019.1 CaiB/BaiF CoA-transferase family protein [Croceicoccus sp. F390]
MAGEPLAGVSVLDFTALLPGAVCTQFLADLGADVVKVEPPGTGDAARGPAGSPPGGIFHMTNRNKRSVVLDLKDEAGLATARRMIAKADVLVEGFRPGVMARLGLGWDEAQAINPALVYCSITGYGQDGPLAHKAGHDINYQCQAGIVGQNATDGGRPAPGAVPLADLGGGSLTAAVGILAALFDVQRSGKGRHVDIAMTDAAMALNIASLSSKMMFGGDDPVPGRDILTGGLPCYRTYRTADDRYLAVGALEPKFWQAFCAAIDRPDLVGRGWDMGARLDAATQEVADTIASRTLAEWTSVFADVDACVAPVMTLGETLDHPNTQARGMVVQVTGGGATTLQYALPIRMTDFTFAVRLPPPALGEHDDEVP